MKKRFSKEQIIGFLREAESGLPVAELCHRHGFSEANYYLWRGKYGGMSVPDAKRLRELEAENSRLKRLRHMIYQGLSERHALRVIDTSSRAYRYQPAADRTCMLRQKIISLAQRHRRYGSGIIHLKLHQAGEVVNNKRVDRLYAEVGQQVRKRKRKMISQTERHPLVCPTAVNQV